jgi:hypothetical protein
MKCNCLQELASSVNNSIAKKQQSILETITQYKLFNPSTPEVKGNPLHVQRAPHKHSTRAQFICTNELKQWGSTVFLNCCSQQS